MRHPILPLVVIATALATRPARGQDAAATASARETARQGLIDYDGGHYAEAAEKLGRALQVVRVPTLALFTARALEKQGKLVEAAELYLEATRLTPIGDLDAQRKAQADAVTERRTLMPRLGRVIVQVKGASAPNVKVEVNGAPLPSAMVGAAWFVNPGRTGVRAVFKEQVREKAIVLTEGQEQTVELFFQPSAPGAAVQGSSTLAASPAADSAPAWRRVAPWAAFGVGGVGLIVGGVAGAIAISKRNGLDNGGCVDGGCYADQHGDIDSYNAMRNVSTVGFVVGAVGVVAGGFFFLTTPKPSSQGQAWVRPWVGAGSLGVVGRFE